MRPLHMAPDGTRYRKKGPFQETCVGQRHDSLLLSCFAIAMMLFVKTYFDAWIIIQLLNVFRISTETA